MNILEIEIFENNFVETGSNNFKIFNLFIPNLW